MLKHEHFEELCAAASIGQASGAELAELREHIAWCSTCQERYSEFLGLNAAQYAKTARDEELSREEAVSSIDSTLFRERFLKKAEAEGIVFSGNRVERSLPDISPRPGVVPILYLPNVSRQDLRAGGDTGTAGNRRAPPPCRR